MAPAKHLLAAMVLFLQIWALLLTVFKFFFTIWQLFYFKNKPLQVTQTVLQMSATAKTSTSWHLSAAIATVASAGGLLRTWF
jgi:hypothetical protein